MTSAVLMPAAHPPSMSTPTSPNGHPNRQPKGTPTGGQFAASAHAEADVTLTGVTDPSRVAAAIAQARATGKPVRINGVSHAGYDPGFQGSSCGDISLGAEPSHRATWATGDDVEPFITATATYFVTARRDGDTQDLDYDDWVRAVAAQQEWAATPEAQRTDEPPAPIRYAVECQTEWIAHTDVDEPGMSEVRADYQYDSGSDLTYATMAAAERVASNKAEHEDFDHYHPENWT